MEVPTISPRDLFAKLEKGERVFLLDVRSEDKFKTFRIEHNEMKTCNIPSSIIKELTENDLDKIKELPKDAKIIITCTTGNSARRCAEILSPMGYLVLVLEGGITAWNEFMSMKNNGGDNNE